MPIMPDLLREVQQHCLLIYNTGCHDIQPLQGHLMGHDDDVEVVSVTSRGLMIDDNTVVLSPQTNTSDISRSIKDLHICSLFYWR